MNSHNIKQEQFNNRHEEDQPPITEIKSEPQEMKNEEGKYGRVDVKQEILPSELVTTEYAISEELCVIENKSSDGATWKQKEKAQEIGASQYSVEASTQSREQNNAETGGGLPTSPLLNSSMGSAANGLIASTDSNRPDVDWGNFSHKMLRRSKSAPLDTTTRTGTATKKRKSDAPHPLNRHKLPYWTNEMKQIVFQQELLRRERMARELEIWELDIKIKKRELRLIDLKILSVVKELAEK